MMRNKVLVLGVFAALVGVYVLVSGPVAARQAEIRKDLAAEHERLTDLEHFAQHSFEAKAELSELEKDVAEIESYLVTETDSTSAFARLQMEVQDLAGAAGLSLTSIRPLETSEFDEYLGLSMQVEARGNIIQVGNFLKKLDSLRTLIGMGELSLTFTGEDQLKMKAVMNALAKKEGDRS